MKILFGFILGFFFGLISIYTAINQNKPEIKEKPHYGKTYVGNVDTLFEKEIKIPFWNNKKSK